MDKEIGIVLACGESINLDYELIEIANNYFHTIGVNLFPIKFNKHYNLNEKYGKSFPVNYWIFSDPECVKGYVLNNYNDQNIVINDYLKEDIKLLKSNNIDIYDTFKMETMKPVIKDLKGYRFTTTISAIKFMHNEGFKKILIAGMDNSVINNELRGGWKHFYDLDDSSLTLKDHVQIKHISKYVCSLKNYIEMYKANTSDNIHIKTFSIFDLLMSIKSKLTDSEKIILESYKKNKNSDKMELVEEINLSEKIQLIHKVKNGSFFINHEEIKINNHTAIVDSNIAHKLVASGHFKFKRDN